MSPRRRVSSHLRLTAVTLRSLVGVRVPAVDSSENAIANLELTVPFLPGHQASVRYTGVTEAAVDLLPSRSSASARWRKANRPAGQPVL